MVIQFWRNKNQPDRNKILAFENAYHGDTFGAMSVSNRGLFTNAFKDFLFDTVFIETPSGTNFEKIKSVIQSNEGRIAAFIYEPLLQAAGGMKMYEAKYMDELLAFIQSEKILCVADEVLTGFGRTGTLFAGESIEHTADIICLSKVLLAELALGVTACSQILFNAFLSTNRSKTFFNGHSFTANTLAYAAALASLDLLEEKVCQDQIGWICSEHTAFVKNELSNLNQNLIVNVRVMGTILAFELDTGKHEYINEVSTIIMKKVCFRGFIFVRSVILSISCLPIASVRHNSDRYTSLFYPFLDLSGKANGNRHLHIVPFYGHGRRWQTDCELLDRLREFFHRHIHAQNILVFVFIVVKSTPLAQLAVQNNGPALFIWNYK